MKTRLLLYIYILLSFLFLSGTPVVGATPKGIVVLKEGVRLATQIRNENTIYKVSFPFDLKGGVLRIPRNCVLFFDGGSIVNGTIVFDDTELAGYPQIRCNLKGMIHKADITWFGASRGDQNTDVGHIINQVQAITNHIIIPSGEFYQTTESIRIEGSKYIDWIGTIISICPRKQYDAFTVATGVVTIDMKGALLCKSKEVRYERNVQTEINGLVVECIYNSTVNVGTISGFNTGMKVFGFGGGCSYNMFNIRSIRDCNTGILITQRDKNGEIGWANENTFIGGRFGCNSSWDINKREIHAVVAKGIYSDDNYNRVNSLYFLRPCTEGNIVPYVFNNATIISVVDCRTEGGTVGACISGKSNRIQLSNSFGSSLSNLDLSSLTCNQSSPFLLQQKNSETFRTISFNVNDSHFGIFTDKGFMPKGLIKHISYKGVIQNTECPVVDSDVSPWVPLNFTSTN